MPDDTEVNKKDLETPEPIIAKPKPVADEVLDKVSLKMEDPDQDPIDDDMEEPIVSKPPKSKKKLVIIGVVVLLVAAAIGAWFIFGKKEKADKPAQQENTSQVETTKGDTPIDIVYAHSDTAADDAKIYKRPATGGERVEVGQSIPRDSYVRRFGDMYTYVVNNNELWLGKGAEPAKKLYTTSAAGKDVLSAIPSSDGAKIVFSIAHSNEYLGSDDEPEVWSVNLDGSSPEMLFKIDHQESKSIYLLAYESATSTTYFEEGCYQCDCRNPEVFKYVNGTVESVYDTSKKNLGRTVFNAAANKFLYVESTEYSDSEGTELGIGGYSFAAGSPYTVYEVDVATKERKILATVGKRDPQTTPIQIGWSDDLDNQRPVYSEGAQVFLQNDAGKFDVVYDNGKGLVSELLWVTSKEVIVSIQTSEEPDGSEDFDVHQLKLDTQFGTVLLAGTSATQILAITR